MSAKLTVGKAAAQYIEVKAKLRLLDAQKAEAERVLKEWFHENSDKREYKGLIGYATGTRTTLDTDAVKAELGDRLPKFQKTIDFETLSVLKS